MYEYLKKLTSTLTDNLTKMAINSQVDIDSPEEIVSMISEEINLIDALGPDFDEEIAVTYLITLTSLILMAYAHSTLYGELHL